MKYDWMVVGWGRSSQTLGTRDGETQRRLDFSLTLYLLRVCDKFPVEYNGMTDSVLASIGSSLRKILWRKILMRRGKKQHFYITWHQVICFIFYWEANKNHLANGSRYPEGKLWIFFVCMVFWTVLKLQMSFYKIILQGNGTLKAVILSLVCFS